MIKVYLDHNVYQDLKKVEHACLLEKILASKRYIVYCFSEAHLYDLNQDSTDYKFDDMKFIESIADSNCCYFTDRTEFSYRSPTQYYEDYDWSTTHDYEGLLDSMTSSFSNLFKLTPLPLNRITKREDLSPEMPEEMKRLLTEPSNMFDFMETMMNMTSNLRDQPNFKEHLKFLHKNSNIQGIYESMEIEGYDGLAVTDREKFWSSYAKKFIVKGQEKSRYDLFIEMYNGLEIFGFVKGKPKKQKMMNLLNDGRHAFFGTVCDIIVSKDTDFLEKTAFMYGIEENRTRIVPFSELNNLIDELKKESEISIADLFTEIVADPSIYNAIHVFEDSDTRTEYVRLNKRYLMYFNIMGYVNDQFGSIRTIVKEKINYDRGTLIKQIIYITEELINAWGLDSDGKGMINTDEIEDKTALRTWRFDDLVISLILDSVLYINFYSLDYLKAKHEAEKQKRDLRS